MRAKNKILTSAVIGSTMFVIPNVASAAVYVTTPFSVFTVSTSNATSIGGGVNEDIIIDTDLGGQISGWDIIMAPLRMDSTGNNVTIKDAVIPAVAIKATSILNSAVEITASGGAGLLTVGKNTSITSDRYYAIRMNAWSGAHKGILNSGTIESLNSNRAAIYVTGNGDSGTITNNKGGVIKGGPSAGSSAIRMISDGTTAQIINSGTLTGHYGLEVLSSVNMNVTNKSGGVIAAHTGGGAGIYAINSRVITGTLTNEEDALIAGRTGSGVYTVNNAFTEIKNAGTISSDGVGTAGIEVSDTTTITNTGLITGTNVGTAKGLIIAANAGQMINVTNKGMISSAANTAVELSSNPNLGSFTNEAEGSITAVANQIAFDDKQGIVGGLINKGSISATVNGTAINIADGKGTIITNTGKLIGAVNLGSGTLNNNQGGTISGKITGHSASTLAIDAGTGTFSTEGTIDNVTSVKFNGGTVHLDHSIGASHASSLVALTAGTLRLGADVKSSQLTNNGTGNITLNKSINLSGDFVQTSGNLTVTLVDKTNYGQLKVSGNLDMTNGGKIHLDVPVNTSLNILHGDEFDIITVGHNVVNDAASLVYNGTPLLRFNKSVGLNGKGIRLTADRGLPAATTVTGVSVRNFGNLNATLTDLMNSTKTDAILRRVLDNLESLRSNKEIEAATGTLSNDNSRGPQETVNTTNSRVNALLNNRLNIIRTASLKNREYDSRGYSAGTQTDDNGAWVQGFGVNANQRLREGIAGYDSETYGTTMGLDRFIGDDLVLGLAGTFAKSKVSTKDGTNNSSKIRNYQGAFYGTIGFGEGFFDVMASIAHIKYKTMRNVIVGALAFKPLGRFDGRQFAAKFAYNQPILAGNFSFIPTAFVHHNFSRQDAYSETNAATVGLQVDKQSANSFEVGVGATLSYDATNRNGGIVPSLEVHLRQDLVGDRLESTNTFIGGGIPFNLRGASVARTSADIGMGFKAIVRDNLNVLANYTLARKSTYHAHVGSFTVRYAF